METDIRYDLKIFGDGNASGGKYNRVIVKGQGSINGDVECVDFTTHGSSQLDGSLKAVTLKILGETVIRGDLAAEALKLKGNMEVQNNLKVKRIQITGIANIGSEVSTETLELKGIANIKGDCNSEFFHTKGMVTISGLLNVGSAEFELYGPSAAKEIGGEKICIKRGASSWLRRMVSFHFLAPDLKDQFTTEIIEGDDIYLEATKAKVVRGNNVQIGSGCEIELVEYHDHFQLDEGAVVGAKRQI